MRILMAQLNLKIGAIRENVSKINSTLSEAKKQKADIVLFPEMTICGYPPEDLVLHADFVEEVEGALQEILPHTEGLMVLVGLVRRNGAHGEKPRLNSAAIIQDGKLLGFYDKWLLPTYDVFDERRYFEKGKDLRLFEWKGKKIAVVICEDMWQHAHLVGETSYPRDPVEEYRKLKPDLLLNLSASPYQLDKPEVRVRVCQVAATSLQCPVFLCCEVGGNDEIVFDGYSVYVDKEGNLRQLGKGFTEDLILVDLEAEACPCPFSYDPLQDLYHALVLGTRDYFHKQGFKQGIIGLSGGIDSALTACIAVEALGKENVYGVAMPSRYSSQGSIGDAKELAQNLGIKFDEISIENPFEDYLALLRPYFQGKERDVTEENLQARIRGMILMALSNKLGALVLSTGNKSELALGYCTLYGDMAGGLSVISDVTKLKVYELARWINRQREIIPKSSIEKPPSAELRENQKDADSLPPYEVIDAVVAGYVEDLLSPEEVAKRSGLELEVVEELVKRIHRAEYKRRQAAPGIRVSKKSFRVGRKYPIVEGWR